MTHVGDRVIHADGEYATIVRAYHLSSLSYPYKLAFDNGGSDWFGTADFSLVEE